MDEPNLQLMSPEVGQLDLAQLRLTQLWLRLLWRVLIWPLQRQPPILHVRQLLLMVGHLHKGRLCRGDKVVVTRRAQVQYNIAIRHVCFRWGHHLLSCYVNENNLD